MNSVKFYLKDKSAVGKSLIYASFFLGQNKRLKISTKLSIEPKYWNSIKQISKQGYSLQYELNKNLKTFEEKIYKAYYLLKEKYSDEGISSDLLKMALKNQDVTNQSADNGLIPLFVSFVSGKSKSLQSSSLQTYLTTIKHLKDFESYQGRVINISDVSGVLYHNLSEYLYDKKKLNPNSVGKNIKNLKTFLNYLKMLGQIPAYVVDEFKVTKVPSDSIALNEVDLKKLEDVNLEGNSRLENTRNTFLFQCYTAIRVSDLKALNAKNIDYDQQQFSYIQKKSKERVTIPFTEPISRILVKCPTLIFKIISEQKYRDYLKELCKIADLNDEISLVVWEGRKKNIETFNKYELVTTHSGRRTFASLSLKRGMRDDVVMKFTGHKDKNSFYKYIKITSAESQKELLKAWNN